MADFMQGLAMSSSAMFNQRYRLSRGGFMSTIGVTACRYYPQSPLNEAGGHRVYTSDNTPGPIAITQYCRAFCLLLVLTGMPASARSAVRIFQIQGSGAVSPMAGRSVRDVAGVVTFVTDKGFYLQDPAGDGDKATSDALFVYTHDRPGVRAGEHVTVSGKVDEYQPGGRKTGNLTVTEIHAGRLARAPEAFKNDRVQTTVIGRGGRLPPTEAIAGPVPGHDGIAFYESLEGMRVRIQKPQVVGPVNRFGEIWVIAADGRGATGVDPRGGITVRRSGGKVDYNPERIRVDFPRHHQRPRLDVGTRLNPIQGVISYSYGNYELLSRAKPHLRSGAAAREVAGFRAGPKALTIASYNVENLGPDETGKFKALARQIVTALRAPDILALQEVQDDDGPADSGQTSAANNLERLVVAVGNAGGPTYRYIEINPLNNRDGGEPGGNIRQAFLYNPARVSLAPGSDHGNARRATQVVENKGFISLSLNPGRIAPRADPFTNSRKPLAAAFDFHGRRLIVVDNHLAAKDGGSALYGARQPPVDGGEKQRREQARILRRFATRLLNAYPHARLIVLGDFNDFGFAPPLRLLSRGTQPPLYDLLDNLRPVERYTYIYQGNSQALDHLLVSPALRGGAAVDIVHVNAGFSRQVSDHDPVMASFRLAR